MGVSDGGFSVDVFISKKRFTGVWVFDMVNLYEINGVPEIIVSEEGGNSAHLKFSAPIPAAGWVAFMAKVSWQNC